MIRGGAKVFEAKGDFAGDWLGVDAFLLRRSIPGSLGEIKSWVFRVGAAR